MDCPEKLLSMTKRTGVVDLPRVILYCLHEGNVANMKKGYKKDNYLYYAVYKPRYHPYLCQHGWKTSGIVPCKRKLWDTILSDSSSQ